MNRRGTGWQDAPLSACSHRIRQLLPADLRSGWLLIERGLATGDREREAIPAAAWIAAEMHKRLTSLTDFCDAMGSGAGIRLE